MATFWEMYNFKLMNDGEIETDENSIYDNDAELLIEFDGEIFECSIADLDETDGQLVLKVGERL